MITPANPVSLSIWRRTVAEMYYPVRQATSRDAALLCQVFRKERDELFSHHPQSPLSAEQKAFFNGLSYYPYSPEMRVVGKLEMNVERIMNEVDLGSDGSFRFTRIAWAFFTLLGFQLALNVYWIEGYGGGIFLPFQDRTCGMDTYGSGRYLYDTIKGADLGILEDQIVLDFNYAYNPSCAYNSMWVCPLSPPENKIEIPVLAGEKNFT